MASFFEKYRSLTLCAIIVILDSSDIQVRFGKTCQMSFINGTAIGISCAG